eukprot:GFUD01007301.1.p1 GENE.GFUD01007301.1~~GFUD01007301.1.p1  ORF type:complete len:259 (+),score=54.19 GFUD01007301.1:134-910(+)
MSGLGLFRLHPGFRGSSSSSDDESQPPPPPSNPNRVKRALFGPTDHEENLRFVRKEMKKAKNEAASKWNFDFDNGTPLKGRFSWEEAKPSEVHAVYNLDRLPYLATNTESETKENRVSTSPETSQLPDPLAEPSASIDDLRTPQQGTSAASSSSSTASSELPPPSELGARPKESKNAKEKKLTDLFRSRKSRSKSSSKLRLKRLGEGAISSRSPSVKSRGISDTVSQGANPPKSERPPPVSATGPIIATEKTDESNSD